MAQVLIVINDDPEGNVTVTLHMEPQVQRGQTEFTNAQRMGAVALNAVNAALTEEKPLIELPKPGKLEIVGKH